MNFLAPGERSTGIGVRAPGVPDAPAEIDRTATRDPYGFITGYEGEPSFLASAFELINPTVNAIAYLSRPQFKLDPAYDADQLVETLGGLNSYYAQFHMDNFIGDKSRDETMDRMSRIDREDKVREVFERSGWRGTVAGMAAGVLDPTIAIPVIGWAARGVTLARSGRALLAAGEAGVATAGAVALQEGVLQATQETRAFEESVWNVAGAAVVGALLGGAIGGLSRGGFTAVSNRIRGLNRAAEQDAAFVERAVTTGQAQSAGAAATDASRGTGELAPMAGAQKTILGEQDPLIRTTTSESLQTRLAALDTAETPLSRVDSSRGITASETGPVEAMIREARGPLAAALKKLDETYSQYALGKPDAWFPALRGTLASRAGSGKMTYEQFKEEVSAAWLNGDEHAIPEVQQAADFARKHVLDFHKNDAVNARVPGYSADMRPQSGDKGYIPRDYDTTKITAERGQFKAILRVAAERAQKKQIERIEAWKAKTLEDINQQIADLELTGDARAAVLADLEAQQKELREGAGKRFAPTDTAMEGLRSRLATERAADTSALGSGTKATREEIATTVRDAGTDYADYVTTRNALATRLRRIRGNIAGREDQVEALRGKIADTEAANVDRLWRMHTAATKLETELDQLSPEAVQTELASLRTQFAQTLERSNKAQERLAKAKEKQNLAGNELTPEEKQAAAEYTFGDSHVVNQFLRGMPVTKWIPGAAEKYAAKLDAAIGKSALPADMVVFRGVTQSHGEDLAKLAIGEEWTNVAYMSTSVSEVAGKQYGRDGYVLRIAAHKGDPAIDLRNNTAWKGEEEYLFGRGAVLRKTGQDGNAIDFEIVSPDPAPAMREVDPFMAEAKALDEMNRLAERIGEVDEIDPHAATTELRMLIERRVAQSAQVVEDEGRRILAMTERMRTANPDLVRARVAGLRARVSAVENKAGSQLAEMSGDELDAALEEIINNITGNGPARILTRDDIVAGPRGPLKERVLNFVSSKELWPYLTRDAEALLRRYSRTMASDVAFYRKFGSTDMAETFRKITDDYNAKIAAAEARITEPAKRKAEVQRLDAAMKADIRDLAFMRDRLRGTAALPSDPNAISYRAVRVLKNANYLRVGGGFTLSSLTDPANLVAEYGLNRVLRTAFHPFVNGMRGIKMSVREAQMGGTVLETVLDSRAHAIADVGDDFSRGGSKFERALEGLSSRYGLVTLLAPWTQLTKSMSAITGQTRMLQFIDRLAKGENLSAKNMATLADNYIDKNAAGIIAEQFAKHGEKQGGGVWWANTEKWDNTPAVNNAARAFRRGLAREVDKVIPTPGQDKAIWMSGGNPLLGQMGPIIGQFQSFAMGSTQRVLMARLQRKDANALLGSILQLGLGGMIYYLKAVASGNEVSDNPAKWITEAVDRSGMTGWLMSVNNFSEKVTGGAVGLSALTGEVSSRYASRNALGSALGPSFNMLSTGLQLAGAPFRRDGAGNWTGPDASDVHAMRQLLPWQNLLGLSKGFDAIEAATVSAFGMRPRNRSLKVRPNG